MVYIPPQLVIGGIQAAAGIFGASAKQRSANDAARREANVRNRNALRSYTADLDNYKRQVEYQTKLYEQQKVQYQQQLQFNNQYLQEAYTESQTNLQNLLDQTSTKNLNSLVKYYKTTGQAAAKGMTGSTAERISAMNAAALGRLQSTRAASYEAAKGERINRDRIARLRTENLNNQAYARVAVAPSFAGPPVFGGMMEPQLTNTFGMDAANAGLAGLSTAFSGGWNPFEKPGKTLPTPEPDFSGGQDFVGIGWGN